MDTGYDQRVYGTARTGAFGSVLLREYHKYPVGSCENVERKRHCGGLG